MRILVAHNALDEDSAPDEEDVLVQARSVGLALEKLGHEVEHMACNLNLVSIGHQLKEKKPNLVFNLVEGLAGSGRMIHFFPGFLDAMALIMLTIPIIYPVVLQMNYDPIWFGVVIVLISQIAVLTPPVGINVYVVKGIVRDVPIATIFRGTFPFLVAMVVLLAGVLFFPDLVLWLPRLMNP